MNTALGLPSIPKIAAVLRLDPPLFQTGGAKEAEKQLASDVRAGRISSGDATALRVHKYILQKDYPAAEAELVRLTPDKKIGADEKITLWLLLTKESQGSGGLHRRQVYPPIC